MDARLRRARALLERAGIAATIEAVGHEGDIAAVRAPASSLVALRELAPDLRALGYRYVAVDLAFHAEPYDQEAE